MEIPFSFEQGIQGPKAIYLKRRKVTRTEIVKGICNQKVYLIILFLLALAIVHFDLKVFFPLIPCIPHKQLSSCTWVAVKQSVCW